MSPLDFFDYSKMKARPGVCLLLFVLGGVIGVIIDMLGTGSFTTEPVFGFVSLPLPAPVIMIWAYVAAGLIVGAASGRQLDALIYGASVGQCQFLLPFIIELCFIHSGDALGVIWRCMCGLPLTMMFAAIGFRIRSLVRHE